ncbi:flagellar protein FliT [Halomonas organivorans]
MMDQGREADGQRHERVIIEYENLLALSERMLAAAREADWPTLVEQETDYVRRVERLSRLDTEHPREPGMQRRKAELLERILDNDLEVRERLIRRRDELGELIGTSRRQRDLQRAYGSGRVVAAEARFGQGSS